MTLREEYIAQKKAQLDLWNTEMDLLEAKAMRVRDEYQAKISTMRAKHKEGLKQLESLEHATTDSWDKFKNDIEHVFDAIKDSVHQFQSHFK
jgi:recombinational DNA repair ATPase RecF